MYVYLVEAADLGRVKIGKASDPIKRLAGLQTGCPVELKLVGCIKGAEAIEAELHALFARLRVRGEWFHDDPAIRKELASRPSWRTWPLPAPPPAPLTPAPEQVAVSRKSRDGNRRADPSTYAEPKRLLYPGPPCVRW